VLGANKNRSALTEVGSDPDVAAGEDGGVVEGVGQTGAGVGRDADRHQEDDDRQLQRFRVPTAPPAAGTPDGL
jgi:hypothetical protein